jgi:hypothetical protein
MEKIKFKTLRHIETVRNFLNLCIKELLNRGENHDQSKLETPEVEVFDKMTSKLAKTTYGSNKYKQFLVDMKPALDHHYAHNRHHPEHHKNGIADMNLIDILEMVCDWRASSMRHQDGNILKSIELNQKRFNYSDELKSILENTAKWMDSQTVIHNE